MTEINCLFSLLVAASATLFSQMKQIEKANIWCADGVIDARILLKAYLLMINVLEEV